MKTMFKIFLMLVMILGLVGIIQAQTISITKYPMYIPAPAVDGDTSAMPFAIYVTFSGGTASSDYFLKVGTTAYTDISFLLYTFRNQGTNAGTWGKTTSYNSDNFSFHTNSSGNWEGWIPVKAHKTGITQLRVRARLASGSNVDSPARDITSMITAGSGAGYVVGNLLNGTGGTKENKVVLAYNGTTVRGIWFSENDSSSHYSILYPIGEKCTNYTTALSFVTAQGGYAMLLPSGTTSIDKLEVYTYPNNTGSSAPVATSIITYSDQNITVPDSIPAAGRSTSVATASNITLDVNVPDGSGTATVSNNAVGTLNGTVIFGRNASTSVTISVIGISAGPLDQVRLTVPTSDFTGYSSGNVTLGGAFAGKTPSFSGSQITIASANLGTTAGTITITGLTSPTPTSALQNGNSTWNVKTATSGGTLTNINSSPTSYTIIPIANVRTGGDDGYGNDATGETSKMAGQIVAVTGVATIEDKIIDDIPTHTSFFIQEAGYGLQVYYGVVLATPFNRGDSLIILGAVANYGGQSEVAPLSTASPNFFVIGAGILPSPVVLASESEINESVEGKLIKLNTVNWNSAGTTFTDSINKGRSNFSTGTDTGTIIISKNNSLYTKSIPTSSQLVGIIYERSDIVTGSHNKYKVAPRDMADIAMDPADGSGYASIKPISQFPSLTAVKETLKVNGDLTHTVAGMSVTIPLTWSWDGTSYTKAGTGLGSATASVTGDGSTTPYVITLSGTSITSTDSVFIYFANLGTPNSIGSTIFTVKTRGTTGALSNIASQPTVNITGGFEAIQTGNWNVGATWSGGGVPGAGDDVTMTTLNVTVTVNIDNAVCKNLTITGNGTVSNSGPVLQFLSTGAPQLTVNGKLSIGGGSGGGSGSRGGRPQLTSNGNSAATLIVKGNLTTTSSNTPTNGNAGLNMNEGTVKLIGSTQDTLKNGAGLRLGSLIIGAGTDTKTIVWDQNVLNGTMYLTGLTVKQGSNFIIGTPATTNTHGIGNLSTSGYPYLINGVTIEHLASMTVGNAASGTQYDWIEIKKGGVTNNGTLNLKSPNGSRYYNLGLIDTTKQTIDGNNVGTYAYVSIDSRDTAIVNRGMIVDSLNINGVLSESPGNEVIGKVKTSKAVAAGAADILGGIGVTVTSPDTILGATSVIRMTGAVAEQTGNGKTSIHRYYEVTPTINTKLHASAYFYYDDNDLNGQDASKLMLWKSEDNGVTWLPQTSTVDLVNHRLHATGINSFSRWTMSDLAHALGSLSKEYIYNLGWNMISMPLTISDSLKTNLFPDAISDAFAYEGTYTSKDKLSNGVGYWLKFAVQDTISLTGVDRVSDSVFVTDGWNMIGTLSKRVLVSAIEQNPTDIVKSSYFGYTNTYNSVDTLEPGQAYWVKTAGGGKLYLSAMTVLARQTSSRKEILNEMNSLKITDKNGISQTLYFGSVDQEKYSASYYEMPPVGFDGMFDVRFGTQRYAELIPAKLDNIRTIPIDIKASAYPLTISWNIKSNGPNAFVLNESGKNKQALDGEGKIMINKVVKSLSLEASSREVLPTQFSLSGNYPNPFNPSTKFVVAVPKAALVEIVVYDILGRQVRTLVNEQKSAGYHTIEWNGLSDNGSAAPSGVYFVRMVSEKFNTTQKIMMLK